MANFVVKRETFKRIAQTIMLSSSSLCMSNHIDIVDLLFLISKMFYRLRSYDCNRSWTH
jgi:hypothetical protein